MKHYIIKDEWNIIEEGFNPALNKISESIFSLGNGRMGQRANFEETYTGETLQGNYVAGVYYPDKTRVGWWKNGYPEYFAKVLNAANWTGLKIHIEGEILDLHTCHTAHFKRVLNMRAGYLERSFTATLQSGKKVQVTATRFCSIADTAVSALKYSITPLNFEGKLSITAFIDGTIKNQDSNYDEVFWEEVEKKHEGLAAYLTLRTKKTGFEVCTATSVSLFEDEQPLAPDADLIEADKFIGHTFECTAKAGQRITLVKLASTLSSENHPRTALLALSKQKQMDIASKGFGQLLAEQAAAWAASWEQNDIVIEGDVAAQQAIRFNIFQLHQTYTGEDSRLNIGPKGFTGEKYGGSTYWDTEAYCVPFYLATAPQEVSRNLLIYRYKHLQKAIENAAKLGFGNGAALFPMVTMNGEECHNEWEITFEEIHRNGAIAYAIFNYVRYTGDEAYLAEYGLEVLIGIARFWKQRVNWSTDKQQFVMLGVTGPNEYENNVNNNWYTNLMAAWCLKYTKVAAEIVEKADPEAYSALLARLNFKEDEFADWAGIAANIYLPESRELGIFLQQDGYLDKEQVMVTDLDPSQRPINQHWSWDRILRSCFIKQADVLQGLYFFEEQYDMDTLRRNFNFYEQRTVHESSLSPCVHSILAAKLNDEQRAYEFYLRTARLDLDDYNNDTEDGLHITSMAGTWMSVVEGFAGMRVRNGHLHFSPFLPKKWQSFSFKILFRGYGLTIRISENVFYLENKNAAALKIFVRGQEYTIAAGSELEVQNTAFA